MDYYLLHIEKCIIFADVYNIMLEFVKIPI